MVLAIGGKPAIRIVLEIADGGFAVNRTPFRNGTSVRMKFGGVPSRSRRRIRAKSNFERANKIVPETANGGFT